MRPIDRPEELRRLYRDKGVADGYMQRRTGQPLNGVLHRRQVRFLNRVLASRTPRTLLEIACGPGRLTMALRGVQMGVAVDSSAEMLETALQRTDGNRESWSFLRTDAFLLPFRRESFDAAFTLRFIRHLRLADRQRLYREVHRVLVRKGVFVIDALNREVSYPFRMLRGLERYPVYDALYRLDEIEAELRSAGFRVVAVDGTIKHARVQRLLNRLRRVSLDRLASVLINSLESLPSSRPAGWMLLCEKGPTSDGAKESDA